MLPEWEKKQGEFPTSFSQSQTLAKLAPPLLRGFEVLGWNVPEMHGMCYGCMECGGYYSLLLLWTQAALERPCVLTGLKSIKATGKDLRLPYTLTD